MRKKTHSLVFNELLHYLQSLQSFHAKGLVFQPKLMRSVQKLCKRFHCQKFFEPLFLKLTCMFPE